MGVASGDMKGRVIGAVDGENLMLFNWVMAVLSILSNLLLVLLVNKVKVVDLGSYTVLIYVSAVMDVIIAMSKALVVPNIHMGKYSFVVFGVGTWRWPAFPGLVSIYVFDLLFYQTFCILCYHFVFDFLFYQTFCILCYHFVYRYMVLQSSRTSSFVAELNIWHWTAMGIIFEIICNVIMTFFISHYEPRTDWRPDAQLVNDMFNYYGINMSRPFGHFHVVYAEVDEEDGSMAWNWPIVIYTLSILGLIYMLGVLMLVCANSVLSMMRSLAADSNIRASTHQQFFRALTVVPLVISFTPVGGLVLLPLTGSQFGALGNYLMSITAVYPAWDPLLLIFCIQSYRRQIYAWFECLIPFSYRRISKVNSMSQVGSTKQRSPSVFFLAPSLRQIACC